MKGRWVFAIKSNDKTGEVSKFKARWVGCGYSQVEGIDYDETFASTLQGASMRSFIASAFSSDKKHW
eukprot:6204549-Pleurochrysis_carterae.AAC.3